MKKKGFTLIELVAVIFIVGMLFLIAIPPVVKNIKENKQKLYDIQIENIRLGAENWVSDNLKNLPKEGETLILLLGDLKKAGYVDEKIANPLTKKQFSNDMIVKIIVGEGKEIDYKIDKDPETENPEEINKNAPIIMLKGDVIQYVEINTAYEEQGADAIDDDGASVDVITIYEKKVNDSYEKVTSIDTSSLSEYRVTYIATKDNFTSKVYRKVIVRDTTLPVITVNDNTSNPANSYTSNFDISIDKGDNFIAFPSTVTDNSKENINATVTGTVDVNNTGIYKIVYTASDSSGNKTSLTLSVYINSAPTCNIVVDPSTYSKKATLKIESNSYLITKYAFGNDEYSSKKTKEIDKNGTYKAKVINKNGLEGNCEVTVTNIDNDKPIISYSPSITLKDGWAKEDFDVKVNIKDNISGIKEAKYCKTLGESCTPNMNITLTEGVKEIIQNVTINTEGINNNICVYAKDILNNEITSCSKDVAGYYKLDKTGPVIMVDGHTSDYSVDYEIKPTVYENGTLVYYNPVDGVVCNESDYVSSNSLNQYKGQSGSAGCMKWYVFGDEKSKTTVDMILDHNTTYKKEWYTTSSNASGPLTLLPQLQADTAGWNDSLIRNDSYIDPLKGYTIDYTGYKARLIEANEIAKITGAAKGLQWNSGLPYGTTVGSQSAYFYFDGTGSTYTGWQTQVANSTNKSSYAWLYDYTYGCTSNGCNTADSGTYGYWTSSASAFFSYYAWNVYSSGHLNYYLVNLARYGVRPVITIPKSLLHSSYTLPTGSATDNFGGNTLVTTSGSINTEVIGNYPIKYSSVDNVGNSNTLTLIVNVVDKIAPIINGIELDKKICTSDNVIVTVNATDNYKLATKQYSFDDGTYQSSNSKTYSANGTYKVKVKDNSNNERVKNFWIDNIDKSAPSITYKIDKILTDNIYGEPFTLTLNIEDSGCGNSSINYLYCVTNNGSDCTPNMVGTGLSYSEYIDKSGQYKICTMAIDGVGNSSGVVCSEVYNAKLEICLALSDMVSYVPGTEYICDPGDGKERNFYVLDSSADTVSLIMDRNIGGNVNHSVYLTETEYLNKVTSGWVNVNVNLPSAQQIASAGGLTDWTPNGSDKSGLPGWLKTNLNCQINTCTEVVPNDIAKTGTAYSYWTDIVYYNDISYKWIVQSSDFHMYNSHLSDDDLNGIRPVIIIPKYAVGLAS